MHVIFVGRDLMRHIVAKNIKRFIAMKDALSANLVANHSSFLEV